jgi:tetratricopeptide (TPR) repeat protein
MRCDFCGGQGKISGAVSAHAPTPLSKQSIAEEMYHKAIALWSGTGYRDPNSAIELFTHALNIDPNNSNTYHARGLAYHQLGRYTAALNDYGRAINLYPDDAEYYNARGNTYYAMNKLAKAKQDWEKACEMGSKQACENLERL